MMSEKKEVKESPPAAGYVVDESMTTEELRQRVLKALQGEDEIKKMTFEEFLAWADEDTLAEWVSGEVIMMSPASDRHQDIADFLISIIRAYVETHQLGWIRSAPFLMKFFDLAREPDLLFLAADHRDRLRETYLDGPADLVVEIISPESAGRDRGVKFYEYESAGIPEYWLIDPEREQAEFYQLDQQGRYQLVSPDEEGRYHAAQLPGLAFPVEWLWEHPPVVQAIKTLGLV